MPFVDLRAVNAPIAAELEACFAGILSAGIFVGGEVVEKFEAEFARYIGVDHAVTVGSGTAALHLALVAAGVGHGDEVIVPANTFIATAEGVLAAGAVPVIVDVDEDTGLMDPDAAAAAVTARTTALIPVHLYGQPVQSDQFSALARRSGLFYLEDAAQAVGARSAGRMAGGLGDAAAFSFYPTKNLGALGDGGAITTNDPELARRVSILRSHGEAPRYHHQVPGFCERLDALQAAFLTVKLAHLDSDQQLRRELVAHYRELLADVSGVGMLTTAPDVDHAHHLFVIRVDRRDAVLEAMGVRGVHAQVHYPIPLHQQPAIVRALPGHPNPVAERLAESVLSLPLYPRMTRQQVDYTVDILTEALRQ